MNEIINVARTEAYCQTAGVGWFRPCSTCPDLNLALGDKPYTSPLVDQAPWFDADDPDTWNFYGFYPLSIDGAENSVRGAPVTEGVADGGVVGPVRQATRSIVISGLLIGLDECAVAIGMSWLRWACLGSNCRESPMCTGDDVCFLSCCPQIDPCTTDEQGNVIDNPYYPDNCLDDYLRKFRLATVTEGPSVSTKHEMSDGGVAWEVQFTIVCAVPWAYGNPHSVFDAEPFPHPPITYNEPPNACPDDTVADLTDPWCPAVPMAPTVPVVPLSCFELPTTWDRYTFPIHADAVRTWQDSVPTVVIKTGSGDGIHSIRLRFYADPLGREDLSALNNCDFCGEFFISYIPANATFTVDGEVELITVEQVSSQQRTVVRDASNVVMGSDGGPYSWPLITCGYAYLLVIDTPVNEERPSWLSVSMTPRGI